MHGGANEIGYRIGLTSYEIIPAILKSAIQSILFNQMFAY